MGYYIHFQCQRLMDSSYCSILLPFQAPCSLISWEKCFASQGYPGCQFVDLLEGEKEVGRADEMYQICYAWDLLVINLLIILGLRRGGLG